MKRRARLVVAAVLPVLALGAAAVIAPQPESDPGSTPSAKGGGFARAGASPPRSLLIHCRSPSLGGTLPARVYLPAGYDSGSGRDRVIYFLHGLPATRSSYTSNAFVADAVSSGPHAAIVVAPQGARADGDDREYLNWGPTENWPQAIASDLTGCIDSSFRTIANRTGRALVGLSAGGYGALRIGLRNLGVFGAVESWSGYFAATDPTGRKELDLGSEAANELARVPSGAALAAVLSVHPTLIGFYVGRQDDRFLTPNRVFDTALTKAGVPHLFRIYPGGHSTALWSAHASDWLSYALDALAAGR